MNRRWKNVVCVMSIHQIDGNSKLRAQLEDSQVITVKYPSIVDFHGYMATQTYRFCSKKKATKMQCKE